MAKKIPQQQIDECFELYLKYGGDNLHAIEKEMRARGYSTFSHQRIRKSLKGEMRGWEADFGWKKSLEIHIAKKHSPPQTSAEAILHEATASGQKLYEKIVAGCTDRDVVYAHQRYLDLQISALAKLSDARDNYANFNAFLAHLLEAAMLINPKLAREIVAAEDALIAWAKDKFVTDSPAQ
jgi:hypothetical protein